MKVIPEARQIESESSAANELILPHGIIGFPLYQRAELLYSADHLPFFWMRLHGPGTLYFVVIEPGGTIPGYEPEIFGDDVAELGLRDSSDAMLLNIVTLRREQPMEATVNLNGPIIVNRRTRIGRQRVIANHARYSAQHPLVVGLPASVESCSA